MNKTCTSPYNSCVKIRRWCLKLISDYPLVNLHFVRTTENLADFLTREGLPPGDCEKFNLHNIQIQDFYDMLPKHVFTLLEWVNFVENHSEYLMSNSTTSEKNITSPENISAVTLSLSRRLENVKDVMSPIEILKEKLVRAQIIDAQKREFSQIYQQCLAAPDFEISQSETSGKTRTFKLISDLLMINVDYYKIYVPPSMRGLLLSYTHLLGHKGIDRVLADLQSYYFPNMYTITRQFVTCCYYCFLTNKGRERLTLEFFQLRHICSRKSQCTSRKT